MPTFKRGDMFQCDEHDLMLVTTNSFVKTNGELVMGRGAAKQLKDTYPYAPHYFGKTIEHMGEYYLRYMFFSDGSFNGIFQVKYHWNKPADLGLISSSANKLAEFANMFIGTIALNFPGIGNGELARQDVLPLLEVLPEHVWVYEL